MGLGDLPTPVGDVEVNNPVPSSGSDAHDRVRNDLDVLTRSGNTELVRQIRYLYDALSLPYPPP